MKAITAKLILVSKACCYLEKIGQVGNLFRYVPASSYAERVNELFARHGLAVTHTDMTVIRESDPPGRYATVKLAVTLCDVDSGETASFSSVGSMTDGGTGGKAVAMAVTDAYKKLWTVAFSIATGDDKPEAYAQEATVKALRYDLGLASTDEEVFQAFLAHRERVDGLTEKPMAAARAAISGALKRAGRDGKWLGERLAQHAAEEAAERGAP